MAQQPLVGQRFLVIDASRSHSNTPNSVGLLLTSDQPNALASSPQHTILATDMRPVGFEPTISASERPQTHTLERAGTGIGI